MTCFVTDNDSPAIGLYLDLLIKALLRDGFEESPRAAPLAKRPGGQFLQPRLDRLLDRHNMRLVRTLPPRKELREVGRDFPAGAETMIGAKRMQNLRHCLEQVLNEDIPGDVIETGVWRGGATILMRGALAAYGDHDRTVWVADSFAGLPPPEPGRYPSDEGDTHHLRGELAVSVWDVKQNFERYGLLDDQVEFLVGWFEDTLPAAPIEELAVMRLDGDMYSSTIQALEALYPKLSTGGFAIIDDYGAVPACREAVTDFRRDNGIDEPLVEIDWTGVFWRRVA